MISLHTITESAFLQLWATIERKPLRFLEPTDLLFKRSRPHQRRPGRAPPTTGRQSWGAPGRAGQQLTVISLEGRVQTNSWA